MKTTRWATWAVIAWALSAALGYEIAGETNDTAHVQVGTAEKLRAEPAALPHSGCRIIEIDMAPLTVEASLPSTVDLDMEPLVVEAPAPHVVDLDMEALHIEALPRSATRTIVAQN